MEQPETSPPVHRSLLDKLEEVYPDRTPKEEHSDRRIWMNVGAVKVVQKIRQWYEDSLDSDP